MENNFSNWKKLINNVTGLEPEGADGVLSGASVFLAKDNNHVEGCLYRKLNKRKCISLSG